MQSDQAELNRASLTIALAGKVQGMTSSEQSEYMKGWQTGHSGLLDEGGNLVGNQRTELYLLLLARWPQVEAMQRSDPPSTRKDLFELIESEIGRNRAGTLKRFERLCEDIGLVMKVPGPPKKK